MELHLDVSDTPVCLTMGVHSWKAPVCALWEALDNARAKNPPPDPGELDETANPKRDAYATAIKHAIAASGDGAPLAASLSNAEAYSFERKFRAALADEGFRKKALYGRAGDSPSSPLSTASGLET